MCGLQRIYSPNADLRILIRWSLVFITLEPPAYARPRKRLIGKPRHHMQVHMRYFLPANSAYIPAEIEPIWIVPGKNVMGMMNQGL